MFKTYQGYSDLAFNVSLEGKQRRVVFDGQSRGTSIYSTRDTKEQNAIEGHHWFGDKFWLLEEVDEKKLESKRKATKAKKSEEERKTVRVADIPEAKEYLADTFGVSRSKMKTSEDVLAIAKENNVVLEGLE